MKRITRERPKIDRIAYLWYTGASLGKTWQTVGLS